MTSLNFLEIFLHTVCIDTSSAGAVWSIDTHNLSVLDQCVCVCVCVCVIINFSVGDRAAVSASGISTCFETVELGTYMNGELSYARVMDDQQSLFTISNDFHMTLTFKGSGQNGTLMSSWRSRSAFVLLDMYEGMVMTWKWPVQLMVCLPSVYLLLKSSW